MYTTIVPGPRNDFLPLRIVSMLKFPENAHFDLLQVISKRVESMADTFNNYVQNIFVKALEIIDLQLVCVGWYLSKSE
jgi:hypothetical protein